MPEPLMSDLDWLEDAVEAEAALDYDLQIGGRPPVKRPIDLVKLQRERSRVKLYSLLFGELERLLAEVNFGSGTEAAYTEGRQLIFSRMQSLEPEQESGLVTLLAEVQRLPASKIQIRLRQQLYLLLDASDWQQITAIALSAVESRLLSQIAAG